jgi:hypothetical protein
MRHCLILANQTLTSAVLSDAVKERIGVEPCEFHIVAPATVTKDLTEGSGSYAAAQSREERAYALAQQRLGRALDELQTLGATVEGEVGDPDPVAAVVDALGRFDADEIVVSTLPSGVSQWLRRDVPARLRKACTVPVTHVMASA